MVNMNKVIDIISLWDNEYKLILKSRKYDYGRTERELDNRSRIIYKPNEKTIYYSIDSKIYIDNIRGITIINNDKETLLGVDENNGEIFFYLVNEIHNKIKDVNDEEKIEDIMCKTIKKWKNFFGKPIISKLSPQEEIGLLGELFTLNSLITTLGEGVICYWKGPLKTIHDYVFKSGDLEVKVVGENDTITVNNSEQLLNYENLFIHVHKLNADMDGYNVTDLVNEIDLKLTSPEYNEQFWSLLSEVGYNSSQVYEQRFNRINSNIYYVNSNFPRQPRIDGIIDVRYKIDVNYIQEFKSKYSLEELVEKMLLK